MLLSGRALPNLRSLLFTGALLSFVACAAGAKDDTLGGPPPACDPETDPTCEVTCDPEVDENCPPACDPEVDPGCDMTGGGGMAQGSAGKGGKGGTTTSGGSNAGGAKAGSGGTTTGSGGDNPFPGGPGGASSGGGKGGATSMGGSSAQGGVGGMVMPGAGEPGAPCTGNSECSSMLCRETGNSGSPSMVCVVPCQTGIPCPDGMHCALLGPDGPVCIPDRNTSCALCQVDGDCKNKGDLCLTNEKNEKLCAQPCFFDNTCPAGFTCGTPMGMSSDVRMCLPPVDTGCPCNGDRAGMSRDCSKKMGDKVCAGEEVCDGAAGSWSVCTAPDPAPEVCNKKDDDCDGKADNLPNAVCNCAADPCTMTCDKGFARYPASAPESEGCNCKIDDGEPNTGGTCQTAVQATDIQDAGGKTETELTGTLSADDDVDWFKLKVTDTAEANLDTLHIKMTVEDDADGEFVLRAIRGGDCAKAATAPAVKVYQFCVNFAAGGKGLNPCKKETDGVNECADLSADYRIGIERAPGVAKKSCKPYKIKVVANAGACDQASFDKCEGN